MMKDHWCNDVMKGLSVRKGHFDDTNVRERCLLRMIRYGGVRYSNLTGLLYALYKHIVRLQCTVSQIGLTVQICASSVLLFVYAFMCFKQKCFWYTKDITGILYGIYGR